jgi:aminobutyraldehyde dehydrogenase
MLDTKMLIGSKFVAGAEAAEAVTIPRPSRRLLSCRMPLRRRSTLRWTRPRSRFKPGRARRLLSVPGFWLKLADAIDRDAEAFATLETLNCGKPRIRVRNIDVR